MKKQAIIIVKFAVHLIAQMNSMSHSFTSFTICFDSSDLKEDEFTT